MNKYTLVICTVIACAFIALTPQPQAQDSTSLQTYEYATISYHGKEKTQAILPDGKLENFSPLLMNVVRPSGMEERTLFLNIAINALAKQDYEVVTVSTEEVVMKRRAKK